jgi:hypothetical protein
MDNNQNGGVDRLMWPFRPVAQLIAIDVEYRPSRGAIQINQP